MTDIFDEVSQDLRAERAQRLLQRYGVWLVVLAVLIVAAVGGWKVYEWRQMQSRMATAQSYISAAREADSPGAAEKDKAEQAFAAMAQDGPHGYRVLAMFREAALKAKAGDLAGASALWDKVSADESVDQDLRQTADLLWAQHQLEAGPPEVVAGRLAALAVPGKPYQSLAMEMQALLKIRTGDKAGAVAILRQIIAMPGTEQGVRQRSGSMLAALGELPEQGSGIGSAE